jgi:transposase-like protein
MKNFYKCTLIRVHLPLFFNRSPTASLLPPSFACNLLDATPKSLQGELYGRVRALLDAPDMKTARVLFEQILTDYEKQAPKAMRVLEEGFDDVTAVLELPERYRKSLRPTNGVERLNDENSPEGTCHSHFSKPRIRYAIARGVADGDR